MSDRRAARGSDGDDGHSMPEHLTFRHGADDPQWWAGDVQPHGRDRFLAHRRFRAARAAYLGTLTLRPVELGWRDGIWHPVGLDEWLHSHGLSRLDLGTSAARAIGV